MIMQITAVMPARHARMQTGMRMLQDGCTTAMRSCLRPTC